MTETRTGPQDGGPRTTGDEARDLGRIRRSTADRKVAGVAGGLARHLDVDPLLLRVAFVVLTFFGGAGLIVYAAGWLLVPEDDGTEAVVRLEERSRTVVLAIVGIVAGVSVVAEMAGNTWGPWFPWQLLVVGIVAAVLLSRRDRTGPPAGSWVGAGQQAPTYAGQPAPAYPTQPGQPGGSVSGWVGDGAATDPVPAPGGPAGPTGPTDPAPAGWRPPPPPPAPVVRDPRRRGPVLFWSTMALVVLALGVLGMNDLAGVPVADGAYPAVALGTIGLALVVGAFFGRAGGLMVVGLVTAVVLAATTAAGDIDLDPMRETPQSAASVDEEYRIGVGELVLDLTEVEDLEELDGRVLELDVQVGRIEVVVPRDLTVEASGRVSGPGELRLFNEVRSGIDTRGSETYDAGGDAPVLVLDAEINLGEIVVRTS